MPPPILLNPRPIRQHGPLAPPHQSLHNHSHEGEEEGQEGECLEGVLLAAGHVGGGAVREVGIGAAVGVPVVVLGGEDEGCEPAGFGFSWCI